MILLFRNKALGKTNQDIQIVTLLHNEKYGLFIPKKMFKLTKV